MSIGDFKKIVSSSGLLVAPLPFCATHPPASFSSTGGLQDGFAKNGDLGGDFGETGWLEAV